MFIIKGAPLEASFYGFYKDKHRKFCAIMTDTVSHFSCAPLFQGLHFLTKMLESNILCDNLFIDILSVW